ncbi:LexA family transcriptional regulator [Sphingobacterium sp. 1.A.4]|uniref:LexA family transcriptional regulator n=1 Tax=Sphingobacterium sp. 1.A.4 TaxID=2044603 RepID=UPI000C0BE602|nr:XRE family transcriptional regulator [Sphingobacterium sp. 1.A.4]
MEYKNNNFELIRNEMGLTNREFSALLGIHEQVYSRMKKGVYPIGEKMTARLMNALPGISIDWLLHNKGDRERSQTTINQNNTAINSNGKYIGQFTDEVIYKDEDGNNIFYEISPGRYLMKTKLITEKAKAGYLLGYDNQEFIEELPSHTITVTEFHRGQYLSFEVFGDSMDNGKRGSLGHGDIVTARNIDRIYWRSKLHTHTWDFFVFVTRSEGILIKQIAKHDVEHGKVILGSLNEDKDRYPDIEISLDDVEQIFNVVDIHMKL